MRILGIDPGTRQTGVGVIETQGNRYQLLYFDVIKIKSTLVLAQKLHFIHSSVLKLIRQFQPQVLALENVFYGKDISALVKIGEARACAMLAASEHNIDVVEYSPARVKKSVSGNGRASKEQIQHMVKTLLSMKSVPPNDSADALAVAICYVHMKNMQTFVSQTRESKRTLIAS